MTSFTIIPVDAGIQLLANLQALDSGSALKDQDWKSTTLRAAALFKMFKNYD